MKLLIFLFAFILILPLSFNFFNIAQLPLEENRHLAYRPAIELNSKFPQLFTSYFNDHFGLRNFFIISDRLLRYKLFNVSPNNAIIIGKNNWLFYAPDVNYVDTVNGQPFSQSDIDQIKNNLQAIESNFKKEGIKFYFLIAPNKQSIYPEYLPSYVKKIRPQSRLDQLSTAIPQIINPQPELISAKLTAPVYLKYDTHWNNYGAFVAYQKLFSHMNLAPKPLSEFIKTTTTAPNRDLFHQMGVSGDFVENETLYTLPKFPSQIIKSDCPNIYTGCPLIVYQTPLKKLPRAIIFRDSFGVNLIPFLAPHFQLSTYIWEEMPHSTKIIEQQKPDYVILELTERELWRLADKIFVK